MGEPSATSPDGVQASDPVMDAWGARAEAALKGASLDSLTRTTDDGLARGPLMTAASFAPAAPVRRERFGSSTSPIGAWDIRTLISHGEAEAVNAAILDDLMGAATSVELEIGADGLSGAALTSLDAWRRALQGVHLDMAGVSLSCHPTQEPQHAASLLAAAWDATDVEAPKLRGALNLDPLGLAARRGWSAQPLDEALTTASAWALWADQAFPHVRSLRVDGRLVHEAGGTEVQELAWILCASAITFRTLMTAGLSADATARQIAVAVSLDCDVHLGVAKIRALRRLWSRLAEAFGAGVKYQAAHLQGFASQRMLARTDPWTNIIRTSCASTAAAIGGVDVLTLAPFTDALSPKAGLTSAKARRIARNQQLILLEEAHVARVADPAAGSWTHEALTDRLASAAWAQFQAWESEGGAPAILMSGALQTAIAAIRDKRAEALQSGARPLLGVTQHRDPDAAAPPLEPAAAPPSAPQGASFPSTDDPSALIAAAKAGATLSAVEQPADAHILTPLTAIRLEDLATPQTASTALETGGAA